jgi:metal-responsive CopG/Arc/MetJ family transcriptional regulator
MPTQTQTDQSKPNFGTLYAKSLCISFPGHELTLINELDNLARSERISRSQYIRQIIRLQMDQRKTISATPQNSIL